MIILWGWWEKWESQEDLPAGCCVLMGSLLVILILGLSHLRATSRSPSSQGNENSNLRAQSRREDKRGPDKATKERKKGRECQQGPFNRKDGGFVLFCFSGKPEQEWSKLMHFWLRWKLWWEKLVGKHLLCDRLNLLMTHLSSKLLEAEHKRADWGKVSLDSPKILISLVNNHTPMVPSQWNNATYTSVPSLQSGKKGAFWSWYCRWGTEGEIS